MKTTVDISPDLLEAAKAAARRRGTTLRGLVEEGLQRVLRDDGDDGWALPDCSVDGNGLVPEMRGRPFAEVVGRAYDGRGA